jgi:hypothetical protein
LKPHTVGASVIQKKINSRKYDEFSSKEVRTEEFVSKECSLCMVRADWLIWCALIGLKYD